MENRGTLLDVNDLSFSYSNFSIKNIDIHIDRGQVVGILGITGCGKTTLLKVLYSGLQRGNGHMNWNGDYYVDAIGRRRPNVVYVPQSAPDSMDSIYSVNDQLRKILHSRNMDFDRDLLKDIMERIGRDADMLRRKPQFLSQGERHIAVVVAALMLRPSLIIMDEPTTSLDAVETLELLELIRRFANDNDTSFLISGTSPDVITYVSDFIYIMLCGTFVESSTKQNLTGNPLHPYTQMMMRMRPSLATRDLLSYRFISECSEPGCPYLDYCQYAREECRSPISMLRYGNTDVRCVLWR
ncbi:ATP-binding cassette domain-containing protein [Thermoplasma sp.]|uniref:ATP-binding cassette domain-containing protein n=1 Tax=Thermoplasma sp. TaxID=1973142 RepID=UPI00127CD775|nr:ATP-binding cassette domain-containing protein [Thermoplasma sp.]KAA8922920.1 MAG: ATP-binding cassette domain-containing protein [Thermoplasma sp.]